MRAINKGPEPPSLTAHRQTLHSDYDNYLEKEALRRALATEQRGLCCYCMGRIRPEVGAMKIEHWKSLTGYPEMQLDYPNLLGACMGGEGKPFPDQHCDTRKGDNELGKNPANTAHAVEALVRYDPDGTIRSNDSTFDNQLNGTLNLNCALLKNNRKAVFDAIAAWWKKERERIRRPMPRLRIERKKDEYMVEGGQLTPYCQVAVSFLNQKLGRMP